MSLLDGQFHTSVQPQHDNVLRKAFKINKLYTVRKLMTALSISPSKYFGPGTLMHENIKNSILFINTI